MYNASSDHSSSAKQQAANAAKGAVTTIGTSVVSANLAGAGALSGYAGMASAVSELGLGSVTTAIAGGIGSTTSGAAATAVVTSAVGGPLVMAGFIVGGVGLVTYGVFSLLGALFD